MDVVCLGAGKDVLMAATPQVTVRVDPARRQRWQDTAELNGYTMSALMRRLMDAAVEGELTVPPPPKDGRCKFGPNPADCTAERVIYPWSETCAVCAYRFQG
jgi:hypothetical protein